MHNKIITRKNSMILIIIAILSISSAYSFTSSSGNYSSDSLITDSGGTTANSSDYTMLTAVSQPVTGMTACSMYYKSFVGFMYTLNFSYTDNAPQSNATITSVDDYDNDGNIEINWTDEEYECFEIYRIYRHSEKINNINIQSASLIASGIEEGTGFFEDNRTLNGTSYWYALVAVDQAGNYDTSFISNSMNATANDTIIPKQITNLNITGSGDTATLRWKHVERDTEDNSDFFAVNYKLYRGTSVNISKTDVNSNYSGFSYLKTVSENTTTDTISSSGLYHYIITAIDDADIENTTIVPAENYGNVSLTYTPPAPSVEGGAGGGGASIEALNAFSISRTIIKATLKQGEAATKTFTVSNIGLLPAELAFDITGTGLASLSERYVSLEPGESKTISVYLFASENQKPEVYTGQITVSSDYQQKNIGLIIEVLAKKALFDIKVEVPEKYKYVLINESARANISMINLGDLKPVDVNIYYAVKDLEGNNITSKIETMAVSDALSITRELKIPLNTNYDDYLFYAKVIYGTETAYAADIFHVVETKPATCFDEIQNQEETGIDCGGPCAPCEIEGKPMSLFSKIRILLSLILVIIMLILGIKACHKIKDILIIKTRVKELERYVAEQINRGVDKNTIKNRLVYVGWNMQYIDKAFIKIIMGEIEQMVEKEKDVLILYNKLLEKGYSKADLDNAFDLLLEKHRKRV